MHRMRQTEFRTTRRGVRLRFRATCPSGPRRSDELRVTAVLHRGAYSLRKRAAQKHTLAGRLPAILFHFFVVLRSFIRFLLSRGNRNSLVRDPRIGAGLMLHILALYQRLVGFFGWRGERFDGLSRHGAHR